MVHTDVADLGQGRAPTAKVINGDERCHNQRHEHQRSLREVGPADRKKSTKKRVRDDDDRADPKRCFVAEIERSLKEDGAADQACGSVYGEEEQNDDRGRDPKQPRLIVEAVFKIVREGQRVPRDLRVSPEPSGNELPIQVGPDR